MSKEQRWNRALDLFEESLLKPDHVLRAQAQDERVYDELMWIRLCMIEHCKQLRDTKQISEFTGMLDEV